MNEKQFKKLLEVTKIGDGMKYAKAIKNKVEKTGKKITNMNEKICALQIENNELKIKLQLIEVEKNELREII